MSHTVYTTRLHAMWVFEDNYRLMLALAPVRHGGDAFRFTDTDGRTQLEVAVLERARYTTSLALTRYFHAGSDLLPDLMMRARLYHDARVMEVIEYQECQRLPAPYEIAHAGRFNRDERRQSNHLLNELLRHCLVFADLEIGEPDCL